MHSQIQNHRSIYRKTTNTADNAHRRKSTNLSINSSTDIPKQTMELRCSLADDSDQVKGRENQPNWILIAVKRRSASPTTTPFVEESNAPLGTRKRRSDTSPSPDAPPRGTEKISPLRTRLPPIRHQIATAPQPTPNPDCPRPPPEAAAPHPNPPAPGAPRDRASTTTPNPAANPRAPAAPDRDFPRMDDPPGARSRGNRAPERHPETAKKFKKNKQTRGRATRPRRSAAPGWRERGRLHRRPAARRGAVEDAGFVASGAARGGACVGEDGGGGERGGKGRGRRPRIVLLLLLWREAAGCSARVWVWKTRPRRGVRGAPHRGSGVSGVREAAAWDRVVGVSVGPDRQWVGYPKPLADNARLWRRG